MKNCKDGYSMKPSKGKSMNIESSKKGEGKKTKSKMLKSIMSKY